MTTLLVYCLGIQYYDGLAVCRVSSNVGSFTGSIPDGDHNEEAAQRLAAAVLPLGYDDFREGLAELINHLWSTENCAELMDPQSEEYKDAEWDHLLGKPYREW